MKKMLFRIKNNSLIIKEKKRLNDNSKSLLNTNVISCNELLFTNEYILNNKKIVSTFLSELTKTYNIDTIILEKNEDALMILEVIKENQNIINLRLEEDETLTFSICEALVKTSIKNVSCYNLQPFMIEYLDKFAILVESRNEILFLSNFTMQNNLTIFSSLFYKMTLQLDLPMNDEDKEDFETFCKINKYLKVINVTCVDKDSLEYIISVLRDNNKKRIKIVIHDNIENEETINYLKNFNKKKSKRYKIYFRLVYSNEYIKDNILKQTNNSILKLCGYMIILIIAGAFTYIFYDNYVSMKNVESIQSELKQIIEINDTSETISLLNEGKSEEDEELVINEDIVSIYNVNPETVGWLTVPNTNIDYAVVQTTNNQYYLTHNIFMEEDNNGWVFMDYRNSLSILSDNVIIYAHNRYYNGVMFGTLQNTMRYNWYTNPDNQIITLRTMYDELEYQVFSIYKIETTTDYLQVLFSSNEEKLELFNMLKDRSLYDFEVTLDEDDKILTLSTCADENSRYVLHAVLIN